MAETLTLDQILAAIRQHESGGNYTAKNPHGSASGAYQFIDSTWRSVLSQMGSAALANTYPTAASAPPYLQDQAARFMASRAYDQYGTLAAVPAVWYVGHYNPSNLDYVPSPDSGNTKSVRKFINDIFAIAGGQPPEFVGGNQGGAAPPAATDSQYDEALDERYGAWAWLLSHPVVGQLFRDATVNEWDFMTFFAALQQTDWWKKSTEATRKWDAKYSTDPGQAVDDLNRRIGDLSRLATSLGVKIDRAKLQNIAFHSLRMAWDEDDLQRAVLAEASFRKNREGVIGSTETQVRQLAAQYGIGATDKSAYKFASDILAGKLTIEGVEQHFRNQAKAMFPAFAEQIDNGMTLRQLADPYVQVASNLLEKDPDMIDLSNPIYNRPLTNRTAKGVPVPMSIDEWTQALMTDPRYRWGETANARDAAYGMVAQLGEMFGVLS